MMKNKNKTKPDLSVIIPAYNVEDYISRCLDSLLEQDGIRLEIIIINDGSTDSTSEVLIDYQNCFSNIQIIEQKNQGSYYARTNGLKYVSADYVTFCDSDDYIDENFYHIALEYMIKADADVLQYGVRKIQDGKVIWSFSPPVSTCDGLKAVNHIFEKNNFTCSNCNKIYKANLFFDVSFDEDIRKYEEDKLINIKIIGKARKVMSIPAIGYNYDTREESITTSQSGLGYLDMLKTYEIIYCYVKENLTKIVQSAAYDYCAHLAYCYNYCYLNQGEEIAERDILPKFYKIYNEENLKSYKPENASFKRKVMMNLLRINPKLCVMIYKITV